MHHILYNCNATRLQYHCLHFRRMSIDGLINGLDTKWDTISLARLTAVKVFRAIRRYFGGSVDQDVGHYLLTSMIHRPMNSATWGTTAFPGVFKRPSIRLESPLATLEKMGSGKDRV